VSTSAPAGRPAGPTLHPDTAIGAVRLTVADLDRQQRFYEQAIGLRTLERDGAVVRLGAEPGRVLVELVHRPDAPPRRRRTTGLFHLALLVPDRPELARALRRVAAAGATFSGASDHLVSEALYLDDPEGNGIEIYRDRPRPEWAEDGGEVRMATLPLDLDGLLGEASGAGAGGVPAGTRVGHVHLNVADLRAAEGFYHGVLGFEVTVRGYPGALFVAAGGYHHHIGLNTWAGQGAPAPPPDARGLDRFEIELAGPEELERVHARLAASGREVRLEADGLAVADPSGNRVLLRPRHGPR
jgi:catechol 2,3-dioxygenase